MDPVLLRWTQLVQSSTY